MSGNQQSELGQLLAATFQKAVENDVVSLIVYGRSLEHLSGNTETGRILIVLRDINAATMRRLQETWQSFEARHRFLPMVATLEELNSSTDVFPITFLGMKRSYEVILGSDVLQHLEISEGYFRIRCEQELKNLLLRMQGSFLRQVTPEERKAQFCQFWTAFERSLGAALMIAAREWPKFQDETFRTGTLIFELNKEAMDRAAAVANGKLDPEPEAMNEIWLATIENVATVARKVDLLTESMVDVLEVLDSGDITQ